MLDDVIAAEGSGRLLISDDQTIRTLAADEFSAKASWLQPVLMKALNRGLLSREDYLRAVLHFIDCRLQFITVNSDLLSGSLKDAHGHALPESFSKLASRLGGAREDLASHLSVAFGAIQSVWRNDALSFTVRQAAVGELLENLRRDRPIEQIWALMREFLQFGQLTLRDNRFVDYVVDWLRFHFIPFPRR
jgi:hypothetical protein